MDLNAYRRSESLGIASLDTIRAKEIHSPEYFNSRGFASRVESAADLHSYVSSMQTDRFEPYLTEMGGLSENEVSYLVSRLEIFCRFHAATFGQSAVHIPYSEIAAHYALYSKLKALPDTRRVLEIGPGVGLLSLFVFDDPAFESYHQVEVTEAFYLLQYSLNRYLYREGLLDHASMDVVGKGFSDLGLDKIERKFMGGEAQSIADGSTIELVRAPVAEHFPWWQVGKIAENQYDVITANANLSEMSQTAFVFYMNLVKKVLRPGGYFFFQCLGGESSRWPTILKTLFLFGLVPHTLAAGTPHDLQKIGYSGERAKEASSAPPLVVPNGLFRREDLASEQDILRLIERGAVFDSSDDLTRRMYRLEMDGRRPVSRTELTDRLKHRLADGI